MSGRYVRLDAGRYTLAVSAGEGPAGVHRGGGDGEVTVGIDGGRVDFTVADGERVYYWWRGPAERPGVRLLGVTSGEVAEAAEAAEAADWATTATG